ncbi:genetic suppressor element 1-like [Macrosteles quadrilineatus]|uniref:genetic suppressor element 1-like n=1 Tax=Macrosteles quadrilineatus TaxID=74068 RepID=UPI0023E0FFD7|nr:genetic suppressor element 1-like [Macrosteles quadrilineatus]
MSSSGLEVVEDKTNDGGGSGVNNGPLQEITSQPMDDMNSLSLRGRNIRRPESRVDKQKSLRNKSIRSSRKTEAEDELQELIDLQEIEREKERLEQEFKIKEMEEQMEMEKATMELERKMEIEKEKAKMELERKLKELDRLNVLKSKENEIRKSSSSHSGSILSRLSVASSHHRTSDWITKHGYYNEKPGSTLNDRPGCSLEKIRRKKRQSHSARTTNRDEMLL